VILENSDKAQDSRDEMPTAKTTRKRDPFEISRRLPAA